MFFKICRALLKCRTIREQLGVVRGCERMRRVGARRRILGPGAEADSRGS